MKPAILVLLICCMMIPAASADLSTFLAEDRTDENEYTQWYTCGHYARDLARNASEQNITIGSMILSDNQRFRGWDNVIVNYVIINDEIVVINAATDKMYALNQGLTYSGTHRKYYRLYPDGTQVPSFWRNNFAYTGIIGQ